MNKSNYEWSKMTCNAAESVLAEMRLRAGSTLYDRVEGISRLLSDQSFVDAAGSSAEASRRVSRYVSDFEKLITITELLLIYSHFPVRERWESERVADLLEEAIKADAKLRAANQKPRASRMPKGQGNTPASPAPEATPPHSDLDDIRDARRKSEEKFKQRIRELESIRQSLVEYLYEERQIDAFGSQKLAALRRLRNRLIASLNLGDELTAMEDGEIESPIESLAEPDLVGV